MRIFNYTDINFLDNKYTLQKNLWPFNPRQNLASKYLCKSVKISQSFALLVKIKFWFNASV